MEQELSTKKEAGLYADWIQEKDVRVLADDVIGKYLTEKNNLNLLLFNSLGILSR